MTEWKPITSEIARSRKIYLVYDPKDYYPPMMAKFITGHGWVPYVNAQLIDWYPKYYIEVPDTTEVQND